MLFIVFMDDIMGLSSFPFGELAVGASLKPIHCVKAASKGINKATIITI